MRSLNYKLNLAFPYSLLIWVYALSSCSSFNLSPYYAAPTIGIRQKKPQSYPHTHTEPKFKSKSNPQLSQYSFVRSSISSPKLLTSTLSDNDEPERKKQNIINRSLKLAVQRFKEAPKTYLAIPFVAAFVGWLTNYVAVQMLFYPINYVGLDIWRAPENPLGFIGWQGVVPCKTRIMGTSLVNTVTQNLFSVEEVFAKLDPNEIANRLGPEVPKLANNIMDDLFPSWVKTLPTAAFQGFTQKTQDLISHMNHRFLVDLTKDMQKNVNQVLNVENCVVKQMMDDKTLLNKVFLTVGAPEFRFLTNSGLWFGFILGIFQMILALFWTNPWSFSIGGVVVGYLTNWLAIKWCFKPLNPTQFGPFVLQGQFIRRQLEVSKDFGAFFSESCLTSDKLWHSIMTDPSTAENFKELFSRHFTNFANKVTSGLGIKPEPEVIAMITSRALAKLPEHLNAIHPYVDKTLALKHTMEEGMKKLTPKQFEGVLHPVFEQDELTLILAGAVLGFAAGLIQQGLSTGYITIPSRQEVIKKVREKKKSLCNAYQKGKNKFCMKVKILKKIVLEIKNDTQKDVKEDDPVN